MYIFQNSIRNIFRNKGRNIILALITLIIIFAVTVSFLVSGAAKAMISKAHMQFGNQVTIQSTDAGSLNVSDYLKFGDSDFLQKTEYLMTAYGRLVNVKALDEETPDGNANMIFIATSRADINEEFRKGLRSIEEGKAPEKPGECLVSREFARLNSLNIGSDIKIQSADSGQPGSSTLTVCGIFSDNSVKKAGGEGGPLYNRNNEVITTIETAAALDFIVNSMGRQFSAVYFLKNPDLLENFEYEVREKGLPASFHVSANEEEYEQVVAPVEKLSRISNVFLSVVLLLGGSVLILVSVMSMRERKYEVGVLRAMGMKKWRITLGMLMETLVITAVCLAAGLGAGAAAAQPVAHTLIGETAQEEQAPLEAGDEEENLDFRVYITVPAAGEICLVALLLAGVSSMAGILYITRFEPNQILAEQN